MMKKSNFYQIFLLLSLLASISTSNEIKRKKVDYSGSDCKKIVCEQAHEQAKGLSQLALLDEFVSQTVLLLRDLMQTMDGEIEKSAKSLLRYIHPHCAPTQRILEEVIEKQSEKMEKIDAVPLLGIGIKPMEEVEHEKDDKSIQFGGEQDNYNYGGEIDERAEVSKNNQWNDNYDSRNLDAQKPNFDYDEPLFEENLNEDKFSGRGWSGQWVGIGKTNQQKSHTWTNSHTGRPESFEKTSFSHQSRDGKAIHKPKVVDRDERDFLVKDCIGVGKGSAFWVPNLDQWCQDNCSKGYCPKTHCIC